MGGRMIVGTNLEGPTNYGGECFRNLFGAAQWIDLAATPPGPNKAQNGLVNPDGDPIPAALPSGFPAKLVGRQAFSYVGFQNRSLPPGRYDCRLVGEGQFLLNVHYAGGTGDIFTIKAEGATSYPVDFKGTAESASVWLYATDLVAPIERIGLFAPGVADDPEDVWNPDWTARLAPFPILRTMDMQAINTGLDGRFLPREWADSEHGLYTDAGDNARGVRPSRLIQLATKHGKHLWVNVPDQASDDYVRAMAAFYRDGLPPDRTLYVEYTNEAWNWGFAQFNRIRDAGVAAGLDPSEAVPRQYARRALAIHRIFAEAYGRDAFAARVTPVVGGMYYNTWMCDLILDEYRVKLGGGSVALAVAPYFGHTIAHAEPPDDAATVVAMTPDQLLDRIEAVHLPACLAQMDAVRAVADKFGVPVVAYESGQHLWAPDDPAADRLAALFEAACGHDRMEGIYTAFFAGLQSRGMTLLLNFSFVVKPSRFGQWGILGTAEDDPETSPRYRALERSAMPDPKPEKPRTLADLIAERDRTAEAEAARGREEGAARLALADAVRAAEDASRAAMDAERALAAALPADSAVRLADGTAIVPPSAQSRTVPLVDASDVAVSGPKGE